MRGEREPGAGRSRASILPAGKLRSRFAWILTAFLVLQAIAPAALADDPIRLQLKWHHQFQFAGYYAAVSQGYYAREGLEVEIIEGGDRRPPIEVVLRGDADFGVSDSDVVLARLNGAPLVVCAAIFQHSPYVLLSRRDRGIRSPADLIGKTIMLSDDQGAAQLRAMLLKEGIDPSLVNVTRQSWNLDDLAAGRVDAVSAYDTVEPRRLEEMGVAPSVLRTIDYGVDFYGDTLFTTESFVDADRDRVDSFVSASLEGWEYAMANPAEITDLILAMEGVAERGITREQLMAEAEAMRKYVHPDVVPMGHVNKGRWSGIAETFAEVGIASNAALPDDFLFQNRESLRAELLERVSWITAAVVFLMGLIILWNLEIRRRVRRRTRELREEIARREEFERGLARSEERFRQLAENIRDVFWIRERSDGRFLYVSPAYEEIWGRSAAALYDSPDDWMESVFPEDRELRRRVRSCRRAART